MLTGENLELFLHFLPHFMRAILLLILFFIFYNRKVIIGAFKGVSGRTWLILFLIIILGFSLRFFWINHEQIVATDGEGWVELGLAISDYGAHGFCGFTSGNDCHSLSYPTYPPGYPTLLSVVFIFFEATEKTAFYFSAFMGTLMIFLSFLFSYLWIKKENVALLGAFVFGLIPPILKFSGGVSMEFFAVFFLFLTLISFKLFLEKKSKSLFLLFLSLLLYTSYIRPETAFLPFVFLVIFAFQKEFKDFFSKNKKFFIYSIGSLLLFIIPAMVMIYMGAQIWHDWSPTITDTINHFLDHLPNNLFFFVDASLNLLVFTLFAIIGVSVSFLKEKREFFIFAFLFLFYFGYYTAFEVGLFLDQFIRYTLILYVPLFFFFVQGITFFVERIKNKRSRVFCVFIFILLFVGNFVYTIPYILEEENFYNPAKDALYKAKEKIPEDAYMVAQERKFVRPIINRNFISIRNLTIQENYNQIKNKRLFLFNPDINLMGNSQQRAVLYKEYDFLLLKNIFRNNSKMEAGIYELVEKEQKQ